MYANVSAKFFNELKNTRRSFRARLKRGSTVIESGFVSLLVNSSCNADGYFSIGDAVSSYITLSIKTPNKPVQFEGLEYEVSIGLILDQDTEEIEYVPVGFFTPQRPTEDDDTITFTAFDRITSKMSGTYKSGLKYPTEAKDIIQEISSQTGVSIDTSEIPDGVIINPKEILVEDGVYQYVNPLDGYSHRQVISYIAQLYSKNIICDRNGVVRFTWFSKKYMYTNNSFLSDENGYLLIDENGYLLTDETEYVLVDSSGERTEEINPDRIYETPQKIEKQFVVDSISCSTDETTLVSGKENYNSIQLVNPIMTQERLDWIYEQVKNVSFLPITIIAYGNILYDLMDIIVVHDRRGNTYEIPITNIVQDYDGGLITEISSVGRSEQEAIIKSPTEQKLEKISTDIVEIQDSQVEIRTDATKLTTRVTTVEGQITLLASIDSVSNLEKRMDSAELKITPDAITATVTSSQKYLGDISNINSSIKTVDEKTTKIETTVNGIVTTITYLEEEIDKKADGSTVNSISQIVTTHTTDITGIKTNINGMQKDIQSKADGSTVTSISETVASHTTDLSGLHTSLSSLQTTVSKKADGSTVETLSNTVATHTTSISGMQSNISSMQKDIQSKADGSTVTSISETVASHTTDLSGLKTSVSNIQTTVNGKADNSTVTAVTTRVSTLESTTSGFTASIKSITEQQTKDGKTISDHESRLDISEGQISTKVSNGSIISSINQSAETISIDASKLNLTGYLTISSANTSYGSKANLDSVMGTIDSWGYGTGNTTIDGANIQTGTINADKIMAGTIKADRLETGTLAIGNFEVDTQALINNANSNASSAIGTINNWGYGSANQYIDGSYLQQQTVGVLQIMDNCISAEKIQAGAITADKISANAITVGKLASGIQTSLTNADNAIGKLNTWGYGSENTYIDGSYIKTGTIGVMQLMANCVTADKINVTDLSAIGATIGGFTINSDKITSSKNSSLLKLDSGSATITLGYGIDSSQFLYTELTENHIGFTNTVNHNAYKYNYFLSNDGQRIVFTLNDKSWKTEKEALEIGWRTVGTSENAYVKINALNNKMVYAIGSYESETEEVSSIGAGASNTLKVYGRWGGSSLSGRTIVMTGSDKRLKSHIKNSKINALETINKIKTRQFDWNESGAHWDVGLIADELEVIDPLFVVCGEENSEEVSYKSVNSWYLQGYEIKAIQELDYKNKEQDERLNQLQLMLQEAYLRIAEQKKAIDSLVNQ